MEEAKLLKLTQVTPPDYFNSEGYKLAAFGDSLFQDEIKNAIYELWPDSDVVLYSCNGATMNADWILHAASVAHFTFINSTNVFPWIVEFNSETPRVYVGKNTSTIDMIARKDPRLVAKDCKEAVARAIKVLT